MSMLPQKYVPLGFQQISAMTLASATSLTVPAGSTHAIVGVATNDVTWRDDGTAPTASVGVPLLHTSPSLEYGGDLAAIQFIAVSGSPVLNISYYRVAG